MAAVRNSRAGQFLRRIWNGLRRHFLARRVYRKAPLRVKPHRAVAADPAFGPTAWRKYLQSMEADDATLFAQRLFLRRFGQRLPDSPRHFVLFYCPDGDMARRETVAYVHCRPVGDMHLIGGMCADERAYRAFPKWLLAAVRAEGGLATILARDSLAMLGDGVAVFGHVGELRSRQAALRVGFEDTDDDHLMVFWRARLGDDDTKRLVALAASHSPF
jgi:hypothetical protein